MVSFCDIPLSQIKNHLTSYGSYGIGLTKSWAVAHRLNPVLYIEPNSFLAASYQAAFQKLVIEAENTEISDAQFQLADVLRYIKNYQGPLRRAFQTIDLYRFSDEREWRYVPPREDYPDLMETDASFLSGKERIESAVADLRLTFDPNDIKYIIIRDDSEISEFIHYLRNAKGNKYSYHDIERLTTRIFTAEQIIGDI